MQKIWIIEFFLEKKLRWQIELGNKFLQTAIQAAYLFTYKLNIIPYMCLTNGGKFCHKFANYFCDLKYSGNTHQRHT